MRKVLLTLGIVGSMAMYSCNRNSTGTASDARTDGSGVNLLNGVDSGITTESEVPDREEETDACGRMDEDDFETETTESRVRTLEGVDSGVTTESEVPYTDVETNAAD